MNKSLNVDALVWKKILETTDLEELEMLLKLVISDEEVREVILDKVKNYESMNEFDKKINLTINICNN